MRTNRSDVIDIARGIAILCVVLGHALQKCNDMQPSNCLHQVISSFQMAVLFAISGYVFVMSPQKALVDAVMGKVLRLVIPYLSWVVLLWAATDRNIARLGMLVLHSQFWFLRVLFILFLAAEGLRAFCASMRRIYHGESRGVAGAHAIIGLILACSGLYILLLSHILNFLVCFVSGMAIYFVKEHINECIVNRIMSLASVMFIALVLMTPLVPAEWYQHFRHCMGVCGCAMVVFLAKHVDSSLQRGNYVRRILAYCGRKSLAIYAIHWNLFFMLMPLPLLNSSKSVGEYYCLAFFIFAFWVIASLFIEWICDRCWITQFFLLGNGKRQKFFSGH